MKTIAKKKRGRKARFNDAQDIKRELAATQERALRKPRKAYEPRIPLDRERIHAMRRAIG